MLCWIKDAASFVGWCTLAFFLWIGCVLHIIDMQTDPEEEGEETTRIVGAVIYGIVCIAFAIPIAWKLENGASIVEIGWILLIPSIVLLLIGVVATVRSIAKDGMPN